MLNDLKIDIEQIREPSEVPYELLKLADPSINQINEYLKTGYCFVVKVGAKVIGVLVLNQLDATSIEIKNIAVDVNEQGKGIGKALLKHSETISQSLGFKRLVIGTGNSSINQLALYQKAGFELLEIKRDFFIKNYPEPIFENGIQCKHMLVLEKHLSDN